MPEYMKAVDIKGGKGGIDALFINVETPKPTPSPHQALREGHYPLPPQAGPILGVEFSGTIESFGSKEHSRSFKEGDEVFGLAYGGAYAEYIAVSTKMLLHKPKELSWEVAAGIPETWITATQALHFVGGIDDLKGKNILWHAGASGVSIAGIQLSRRAGAGKVFATAGSDEKCEFIEKELGATKAFNYRTEDWSKAVLEATDGKGVDLIVDFIAGDYVQKNFECAARDGHIVQLALMGGAQLKDVNVAQLLYKRIRWEGSTLRSRDEVYQGELRDRLALYEDDFVAGKLTVFVDKVYHMEQIQEAHRLMEKNVTRGKIICTVP
ncbi:Quinone oxidoreductase PIG3 [Cytospora mali]|uniref:Quinone oxidoreductase PIG3 n=1 Tax=Cytospora mali TaxID=578113 RepID=A0A194V3I3_CYTMA|nr:Quinone oxidoreductase PIG3 [Valsa mali var. pyri (nom. inval.)]